MRKYNYFSEITDDMLKTLHTRQLLNLLNRTRCYECVSVKINNTIFITTSYYDPFEHNSSQVDVLKQKIKNVLATREHIPSSLESKQKRQAMARRTEKKQMAY